VELEGEGLEGVGLEGEGLEGEGLEGDAGFLIIALGQKLCGRSVWLRR
jgi:hypothetical protein